MADVELAGPLHQFGQHEPSPSSAGLVDQRIEGVDPLTRLVGIAVGELVDKAVDHSWSFSRWLGPRARVGSVGRVAGRV